MATTATDLLGARRSSPGSGPVPKRMFCRPGQMVRQASVSTKRTDGRSFRARFDVLAGQ